MDRIRRLSNPIRDYAWGSHSALAELMGRPAPSAGPEAELWMGAHPTAPSRVETAGGPVALDAWIARDPAAVLGAGVAERFGGELPFLLKLIAPERALSLQTHPDAVRAAAGFARENAAGLALDDPARSYRDPRAKPELICAHGPFEALCGFRTPEAIDADLAALGDAAAPLRRALAGSLEACLDALLAAGPAERASLVAAAGSAARERDGAAWACVPGLVRDHPDDPGVLAPLLLHHVVLAPGEALFLEAGLIHAYLRGVGVELMGNSDNVLRGGLTGKHVDVPELMASLDFAPHAPRPVRPEPVRDGERRYATPSEVFCLSELEVAAPRELACEDRTGVEILLGIEGELALAGPVAAGAERLRPGAAVLVPAAAGAYALGGSGRAYRASLPG